MVRVTGVEHRGGYELRLTFSDGSVGDIDLADELWGEMFEPLRDPSLFTRVEVDPELGTVVPADAARNRDQLRLPDTSDSGEARLEAAEVGYGRLADFGHHAVAQ